MVFDEGDTFRINGSFGAPDKNLKINFSKSKIKFCLKFHYNGNNSYLLFNRKEIYKFKADNKNVNFPNQLCLRTISNKFDKGDMPCRKIKAKQVSLKKDLYDFSVNYDAIDKYDILNIHKYLIAKNNIK